MTLPDIDGALDALEEEHDITVLFACESGSRAWGFASPDSDFDLRFIYAHDRDWYLRLNERRDVLDAMLPNDLDLAGWDLRKSLRLFAKSNAALFEWLDSPIVYRANAAFHAEMKAEIPRFFNPRGVYHHYLSMAKGKANDIGHTKIKRLFYILRPLLACRWIRAVGSMPPTAFPQLLAAEWVSTDERTMIEPLLAHKLVAAEGELIAISAELHSWLNSELELAARTASTVSPNRGSDDALDGLFRRWLS